MSEEIKKYPLVATSALIFNDENQLLFVNDKKYGWIIPGGKVELNETMLDSLKREIKEETNLDLENIEYISTTERIDKNYHFIFINYQAKAKNVLDLKLNEELLEYKWLDLDSALKNLKLMESTKALIKDIREKEENRAWEDKYKRALADYQNLQKNTEKNQAEFIKYALEDTILDLLNVYDHLKLSLSSLPKEERKSAWVEGVSHVLRQFKELLERKGVKELNSLGEKFDYQTMEALEGKGDYVVKEVSSGYRLNDKLIRPAKVIVGDKNN